MTANTKPVFALTPNVGVAQLAAANPAIDGTGAIVDLFTAQANGSRVDKLVVKAKGATTEGVIRFFYKPSAGTWSPLDDMAVTAATPSDGVPAFGGLIELAGGLVLPDGAKLGASTHNAEAFAVTAFGGDF